MLAPFLINAKLVVEKKPKQAHFYINAFREAAIVHPFHCIRSPYVSSLE